MASQIPKRERHSGPLAAIESESLQSTKIPYFELLSFVRLRFASSRYLWA
jgi:hypothetical protein